ncbi:TetR family transcriptional regulator [Myceligenerans pegani]|uniref:TetR family transcriptional regulator n=1 Tax=Myceligenerans pegani TaxID=2776917 RepID=A0ABR9MVR3_9MICO|nr:TetR family transcriptional regulator [Myceligenerans sp. TRM 65318]MBE1875472.1 TetR family transcriptional regulator [Myceligenerans sp. TRM 65318]MBE3017743.1 TetR family transcriptional regulator [Myceligenerans sp. TRM 65318]
MRSETPASPGDPPAETPSRSFIETARRRQLIDAAVATVNEVGYHRASLAEIGKRAGIVKSAIGYYFSSKEALLLELVQEAFTALGESVLGAVSGHEQATARLRAYAEAYLAHVDAHRHAIAAAVEIVVSHRTADGTPLYLVENEEDTALLRSILTAGMEQGSFLRMPIKVATGFVESVLDHAITVVQRDPRADLGDLRAHAVPFVLRSLGAGDE